MSLKQSEIMYIQYHSENWEGYKILSHQMARLHISRQYVVTLQQHQNCIRPRWTVSQKRQREAYKKERKKDPC
jgi:hypothetical protein